MLRLIGYKSLSANNRLGTFDRESLKRPNSKKKQSLANDVRAVRGLSRHAAAPSQSLSGTGEIIIMLKVKNNSYLLINPLSAKVAKLQQDVMLH